MSNVFYPENDYRNYLMHYGVKGMKWRRHKASPNYDPRQKYLSGKNTRVTDGLLPGASDPNYRRTKRGINDLVNEMANNMAPDKKPNASIARKNSDWSNNNAPRRKNPPAGVHFTRKPLTANPVNEQYRMLKRRSKRTETHPQEHSNGFHFKKKRRS